MTIDICRLCGIPTWCLMSWFNAKSIGPLFCGKPAHVCKFKMSPIKGLPGNPFS
ncbi:UNVERIFIED_CONTAM: hypothetical protein FKN15_004821 [Acipenser sinensis]